jgi:hypothetical protein
MTQTYSHNNLYSTFIKFYKVGAGFNKKAFSHAPL